MQILHTAHVPAGDGPFPTIFALHGWGASAHDLLGLAPFLLRGEALVLCPQGAIEVPVGPGVPGYGWFPITEGGPLDPEAFTAAAESLGVSPYPFAVAVLIAASAAFVTPVSTPVVTLVVEPGRYRFMDFVKVGTPLLLLAWLTTLLLAPMVFPYEGQAM